MKWIHIIIENTQIRVKIYTKLTNLNFNHELINIMVNKGWIYGELREILDVL